MQPDDRMALRLNRRFAPALSLGVSRIGGSLEAPELDGRGNR